MSPAPGETAIDREETRRLCRRRLLKYLAASPLAMALPAFLPGGRAVGHDAVGSTLNELITSPGQALNASNIARVAARLPGPWRAMRSKTARNTFM